MIVREPKANRIQPGVRDSYFLSLIGHLQKPRLKVTNFWFFDSPVRTKGV